jgi:hypothetical protein
MSGYNLETINVQFLNQSFLDKIDQGLTKEAGVAISAFVRQKLREDGFTRKVLNPISVTAAELDRQVTEEPTIIVEKDRIRLLPTCRSWAALRSVTGKPPAIR